MQFTITNINKSINDIMRILGYMPTYFQNGGEFSIIKKIGRNNYPRFHLYIKKDERPIDRFMGLNFVFNLHLDQKKPSYAGSRGHSGEYEGKLIEDEIERIKNVLM